MGSFSVWHWLIVLAVVLLIFGTKKLKTVGTDVGGAVKGFKDAMRQEQDKPSELPRPADQAGGAFEVAAEPKSQA